MASTTAALENVRRAALARLVVKGWIEVWAQDEPGSQPTLATYEALVKCGATQEQLQAAVDAIVDAASGGRSQPFWWRRKPQPMGPLMQQAVNAYRAWEKRQPQQPEAPLEPNTYRAGDTLIHVTYESPVKPEPDTREFIIDISADPPEYFIDGVEVDEDTYTSQAPPYTGGVLIDIGEREDRPEPVEPEPVPALVELEPDEPPMVEQPATPEPKRPVVFNM